MLQPDAFCEHTMQQNATAAGGSAADPARELITPFRPQGALQGRPGFGWVGHVQCIWPHQ